MKTKIVYISGGEAFAAVDIRAALDEVRAALGLPKDVVIFGLPVDNEGIEVIKTAKPRKAKETPAPIAAETAPIAAPIIDFLGPTPATEADTAACKSEDGLENQKSAPLSPIYNERKGHPFIEEEIEPTSEPEQKKDLEELFNHLGAMVEEKPIEAPISEPEGETDTTLEKLAVEFAETHIAEPSPVKESKVSKLKNILPFKKPKKSDEPSLMGDLFGWAGIAANDDEIATDFFSIK